MHLVNLCHLIDHFLLLSLKLLLILVLLLDKLLHKLVSVLAHTVNCFVFGNELVAELIDLVLLVFDLSFDFLYLLSKLFLFIECR